MLRLHFDHAVVRIWIEIKPLEEFWEHDTTAGIIELKIKVRSHNQSLFIVALEKIAILPNVLCIESSYVSNREAKRFTTHKSNGQSLT
jgi:hypothetical protein